MPKLTKSLIDATRPGSTDIWLWCQELPGFGIRVQPSGRKTYVCRYRTRDSVQRKQTVGRCTDLAVDRARGLARGIFGAVAEGRDPAEAKAQSRSAPTVADLKDRYMREHARPFKKPASADLDDSLWDRKILPQLGRKKVAAVTKADALTLHGSLSCTPATANLALAVLSKACNLAEDWGWRPAGSNPCRRIKKYVIPHRETILTPEQIGRLNATLDVMVAERAILVSMAALVRLLLLTGCRLNEIMSARREWVDRERRLLLLPDSKVGQRRIPLPQAAIAIVDGLPKGNWLIPGRVGGEHLSHPWGTWKRIKQRAGLPADVRLHDLRHTVGSLGHMARLSQRQIASLLGHRQLITTERYLHGYDGDDIQVVDTVAAVIVAAMNRGPTAES